MARQRGERWAVAAVRDRFDPAAIARAVAAAVRDSGWPEAERSVDVLAGTELVDVDKLQLVAKLLQVHPLLLVLDNFETNLAVGGTDYLDPVVRESVGTLCQAARVGKLLVTCRYPLPGLADWLHEVHLGPLREAEARKLLLRLPGLKDREHEEIAGLLRRIGGHPRMLEYVDALVRGGAARLPQVRALLEAKAEEAGVRVGESLNRLDEATRDALLIGAQDIVLGELLAIADRAGDGDVLRQAAVSSLPIDHEGLAHALHGREPAPAEVARVREAAGRLTGLSLLTPVTNREVWVHRWTAESIRALSDESECRERYRRAGEFRIWRIRKCPFALLEDGIEAVENLLEAETFDRAGALAAKIAEALQYLQQLAGVVSFCGGVLRRLPATSNGFMILSDLEARALEALGYSELALKCWEKIVALNTSRTEDDPENSTHEWNLALSYERLGDLHRSLGQLQTSLKAFERSQGILERLSAANPDCADYQRELSVLYERLGDLQQKYGDGKAALQNFERALAVVEMLLTIAPSSTDYQRDLSILLNRVGDVRLTLGHLDGASEAYERSLSVIRNVAARELSHADLQRDLALTHSRIGGLRIVLDQREMAREAYDESHAIIARLAETAPDRADYQRDLAVSFGRVGDLRLAMGLRESAGEAYERSLGIMERLAAEDPACVDHQRDLAAAYGKIGDLRRALGQVEKARQAYERWQGIMTALTADEPHRMDYQRDLGVVFERLASICEGSGSNAEAIDFRHRAADIAERLLAAEPDRADLAKDLAISLIAMAQLLPRKSLQIASRVVKLLQPFSTQRRLDVQGERLLKLARGLSQSQQDQGPTWGNKQQL
jgi:tetratricopeptide (TPR) repeat protein